MICLFIPAAMSYDFVGSVDGENAGDQFGQAMCTMDYNGDGYPDLIVGAPTLDGAGISSGRVYIYYGGPTADTDADMTLDGITGSHFGQAVASAGDFNNDTYEDLLVGAPFYDLPAPNAGAAYIYYGGPDADSDYDHLFTGEAENDYFGTCVIGAGDFNKDFVDDIAIGAYQADFASYVNSGKVYLYYGGSTPKASADKVLIGEADGERFGFAMTAGDYTGNGTTALIVGAYGYDSDRLNVGRMYLFTGGSAPDGIADMIFTGQETGDKYGWQLTTGRYDADIYDDIIMGSDGFVSDTGATGKVYVFSGGSNMDNQADFEFSLNRAENDYLGRTVVSADDLTGDGYHDIISGMPGNDDGAVDAGGIVILRGTGEPAVDTTLYGGNIDEQFGQSAAIWPGFGQSDNIVVAVGAYGFDSYRGRIVLYETTVATPEPECGDANGDGVVNIGDPVFLISYIFKAGPAPSPLCIGNANGDEDTNIGDVVYIISHIFGGGPAPDLNCCR